MPTAGISPIGLFNPQKINKKKEEEKNQQN
jgi:hypothetical protein